MKVMTILGTRPEIIRLSRVMALLDDSPMIDSVVVHTGQNYDRELSDVFFDELGLRPPDHALDVDTSTLGRMYGSVMIESERVLEGEQPDAVLILGDTNSSIAAIMAKRMHIPVVHMEAGNRSFDWRVPEEVNRHIVDAIADVNLVYTEHARRNLLDEGIPANSLYLTGSPLPEVFEHYRPQIDASDILAREGLEPGEYLLVSLHREENVDDLDTLAGLLGAVGAVAERHAIPAVLSLHPRTKRRVDKAGIDLAAMRSLSPRPPFGFFDYNRLQIDARCVISDSGTISEESAILGFSAVTPRRSMERPEGIDTGRVILSGHDPDDLGRAVDYSISRRSDTIGVPAEYRVRDCANRVVSVLLSRPLVGHRG